MNPEDEPQLGDLDSLLLSLVSEGSPRPDETICVDDLLVDEEGLPLALDEETRKARRMARNRRAAAESRDRKKRRVDELEGQVEVLERENSAPAASPAAFPTAASPPPLNPPLPPTLQATCAASSRGRSPVTTRTAPRCRAGGRDRARRCARPCSSSVCTHVDPPLF